MKGNVNGKLKHAGAVCLQTDFCNFKGNRRFCCSLITLGNVAGVQNIALEQGMKNVFT